MNLPLDEHIRLSTFIIGNDEAGNLGAERRQAGVSLNRQQEDATRDLLASTASVQPFSPDGWLFSAAAGAVSALAARAEQLGVPLINPSCLALELDELDFLSSRDLLKLSAGAEAQPFLDAARKVVYKLFDLRISGGLGKKLVASHDGECWNVTHADANIYETMEKLAILHEAGTHPTEIVGVLSSGEHLLVKQPQAYKLPAVTKEHRTLAAARLNAVLVPARANLRGELRIIWARGQGWLLGDLHEGNIMLDADEQPTIIDALTGRIPAALLTDSHELRDAVESAKVTAA